jgi:hypothetical protein
MYEMARNRNRNRNNFHSGTTPPKVESVISQDDQNSISENEVNVDNEQNNESTPDVEQQTPEVISDDVTNKDTAAPQSPPEGSNDEDKTSSQETVQVDVAPQQIDTPVVSEDVVIVSDDIVVPSTEDNPKVARLKEILTELKVALSGHGKQPEDFARAAQINASLVRFVIGNARPEVLDTLLAFYVENIDGVCSPTEFMKGSTTLSAAEEQQLGYLNNLFYQLATRRFVKINNAQVVNVLKRPEISTYFQRRMAGIKAHP